MADTLWESLCKKAAYKLIAAFPEIVRKGSAKLGIPPLTDQPLPAVTDFDVKRKVVRCEEPGEIGDNLVSITENRLNGLDSVARYEAARFTQTDSKMVVPLLFQKVTLSGKWKIRQQCKAGGTPIWTFRSGTYTCAFQKVQVDLTFTLDTQTGKLTAAGAQLTDRTGTWKEQPDVALTFDNGTSGERKVITSLMTQIFKGELPVGGINFKDEVRKVIGGDEASGRMRTIVQAALDAVLGADSAPVLTKLERKLAEAWAAVFKAGNPHHLPSLLPDPLTEAGEVARIDAGFAFPSIPIIGWTSVGNAQFVLRKATIAGLKSVRSTAPLTLSEQGARASVALDFTLHAMAGDWALEQKIRKGICAFRHFLAALGQEPSDDNLDPFRKVEKDLKERGGAMGSWYVSQYYQHGADLQALLENPKFKQKLAQFRGLQIWQRAMEVITSSDDSRPIDFPADLQDDALALITAALDLTDGTPLGKLLDQIVAGSYVFAYMGKNYEQVLKAIAGQTPPAATLAEDAETFGQEDVFSITGSWTAKAVLVTKPVVRITPGQDGAAPAVALDGLNGRLEGFNFDYSGTNLIGKLLELFQKLILPGLKDVFLPFVRAKVEEGIAAKAVLPESFGKVVAQLWETAIPLD